MKTSKKKPVLVIGAARRIKIYKGGRAGSWLIAYRQNGKRRFKRVTGPQSEAEKTARELTDCLDDGTATVVGGALTAHELFLVRTAMDQCTHPGGLMGLVSDYRSAEKILSSKPDLPTLARHYSKTSLDLVKPGKIADIVAEYLAERKTEQPPLSSSYSQLLKTTLTKFTDQFSGSLTSVDGEELQKWIKTRGAAKTQANARGVITHFFGWARMKKYLPRDAKLASDDVAKIRRVAGKKKGLYTPEHLKVALENIENEWLPFFAIHAFAGIRCAELSRIEWKDVNFKRGSIEVEAEDAKTRRRRFVPICPALRSWIYTGESRGGQIAPPKFIGEDQVNRGFHDALNALRKKVALAKSSEKSEEGEAKEEILPRIKNGWRSSFISYRLEQLDNKFSTVAMESGNSEQIIIANYRELTDKETALRWFAVMNSEQEHPICGFDLNADIPDHDEEHPGDSAGSADNAAVKVKGK